MNNDSWIMSAWYSKNLKPKYSPLYLDSR